MSFVNCCKTAAMLLFAPSLSLFLFAACVVPARFTGMVPETFESEKKHPQSVRVKVSGGQEDVAVGRPQITNSAFEQALVLSIRQSQTFSKVVEGRIKEEEFLLTVTLFSMDKLVFGNNVRLEAGWTLQRADAGTIVWRESIVSESSDRDVRLATEGAGRNNIARALAKISRLNLGSP